MDAASAHPAAHDNARVGMWVFLGSEALTFSGLLVAVMVLRHLPGWQAAGQPALPIGLAAGLSVLLLLTSVSAQAGLRAAHDGQARRAAIFLFATVTGGLFFLLGQAQEWAGLVGGHGLIQEGLSPKQSLSAACFFVVTGFHGLHVAGGTVAVARAGIHAARGRLGHVEPAAMFWHFVDVAWLFVFATLYLV